MSRSLAGRVALVTGANHGIGAAIAVTLAGLGADLALTYLRASVAPAAGAADGGNSGPAADGSAVVTSVRDAGVRCIAIEADLMDPATPPLLFDAAKDDLGDVDIVVNNASGWRQDTFTGADRDPMERPMGAVTAGSIDANLAVDARASALLIAELARRHRARGARWGRVVSLGSGGELGFPFEVSYGAAKAALLSYTLSAASELAPYGITANVVHPPPTDTGWLTDEVRRGLTAAGLRTAQPAEVAEVVAWLCTDAARHVSGSIIRMR